MAMLTESAAWSEIGWKFYESYWPRRGKHKRGYIKIGSARVGTICRALDQLWIKQKISDETYLKMRDSMRKHAPPDAKEDSTWWPVSPDGALLRHGFCIMLSLGTRPKPIVIDLVCHHSESKGKSRRKTEVAQ